MFTVYFSITNASIIEPAFANVGSGSTGSGAILPRVITQSSATSSNFKNITMHRSVVRDGLSKMELEEKITIQPGQTWIFKPDGYHLMLRQATARVKIEKSFPLEMKFQSGKQVTAACKSMRHLPENLLK